MEQATLSRTRGYETLEEDPAGSPSPPPSSALVFETLNKCIADKTISFEDSDLQATQVRRTALAPHLAPLPPPCPPPAQHERGSPNLVSSEEQHEPPASAPNFPQVYDEGTAHMIADQAVRAAGPTGGRIACCYCPQLFQSLREAFPTQEAHLFEFDPRFQVRKLLYRAFYTRF